MELTQEMRKSLQRNLPQSTLDFLNEKFRCLEKYEQRIRSLEDQCEYKDQMLERFMSYGGVNQSGPKPMGFYQQQGGYEPWYQENYGQPQGNGPYDPQGRRGQYPAKGAFTDPIGRRGRDRKNFSADPQSHHYPYRHLPYEYPGIIPLYRDNLREDLEQKEGQNQQGYHTPGQDENPNNPRNESGDGGGQQ
jgi:hypothetical protein